MSEQAVPNRLVIRFVTLLTILLYPFQTAIASESVSLVWIIEPSSDETASEITVSDGEYIVKQRLLPIGLATLDSDLNVTTGSTFFLRNRAQIIQVPTQNSKLYCATESLIISTESLISPTDLTLQPNKSPFILCLHDSDSNGRLDQAFSMPVSKSGVVMQGNLPKKYQSIDVGYSEVPITQFRGDYWVGIRYEQYFNIYGNRMLMTDFGGRGEKESLTAFDTFKSKGTYPRETGVLGGKFTILEANPKSIRVRIDKSLPLQSFSVVTNTTVRFY